MPKSKPPSRRPIMALLDVLGRRWTLRVLWELRAGPLSFRALRTAADDVSPSVLNARLAELRELGVVEVQDDGYQLTASGVELSKTLLALNAWANQHV